MIRKMTNQENKHIQINTENTRIKANNSKY